MLQNVQKVILNVAMSEKIYSIFVISSKTVMQST